MNATDRLRALLDERGARWTACSKATIDNQTYCYGHTYTEFQAGLMVTDLTPEQAVEATLGRGTCTVVSSIRHDYEGGYAGTEYEHELSCGDTVWWSNEDAPDYCPWCGRKVIG